MIYRGIAGIFKKVSGHTWVSLILLWFGMGSVAYGIGNVVRGLEGDFLIKIAFLAVILGWWLARPILPRWVAGILAFGSGIPLVIVWVGGFWFDLFAIYRAEMGLIAQAYRLFQGYEVNLVPLYQSVTGLGVELIEFGDRFWTWSQLILTGKPVFDPQAVSLIWGLIMWLVAVWAGWMPQRRVHPLVGMIPAGTLLALAVTYTWANKESGALLIYLASALPMVAWIGLNRLEKRWQATGVDYPNDILIESFGMAIMLSVAVIGIAAVAPSISINKWVDWVRQLTQPSVEQAEPFADSLGLEQGQVPFSSSVYTRGGLPESHLIGAGPELSESLVMEVRIIAGGPEDDGIIQVPLYWRASTYDQYIGQGWQSSKTEIQPYQAGEFAGPESLPFHQIIEQDVRMSEDGRDGLLYAAGVLVSANHDFTVAWRSPLGSETILDPFLGLIEEAHYRVQSLVPIPGEEDLQASIPDYPPWISSHYLDLPDTVPERVISLALTLTERSDTVYDKARALERYLRDIPYTTNLPEPPSDIDVADYFLFKLQRGYCDYYATTMVVMARAVGIPARVAVGYFTGVYDPTRRFYRVSEAEAHSWPEIYFPGIGWVPFEPTGGIPEITWPEYKPGQSAADLSKPIKPIRPSLRSLLRRSVWATPLGLAGLCVLLVTLWFWADKKWLYRQSPNHTIQRLYRRLVRSGRRLALPPRVGDTPYEYAVSLSERLTALGGDRKKDHTHPAIHEVHTLTKLYAWAVYSPRALTVGDQVRALALWRNLRRRLFLAGLQRFWRKVFKRKGANVHHKVN
jgi:hypothetical protein